MKGLGVLFVILGLCLIVWDSLIAFDVDWTNEIW